MREEILMDVLIFVGGICLGSCGGFLLALLVVHGRAVSLSEENSASQNRTHVDPFSSPLWAEKEPRRSYAPSTPATAQAVARVPLRAPIAEIPATGWGK